MNQRITNAQHAKSEIHLYRAVSRSRISIRPNLSDSLSRLPVLRDLCRLLVQAHELMTPLYSVAVRNAMSRQRRLQRKRLSHTQLRTFVNRTTPRSFNEIDEPNYSHALGPRRFTPRQFVFCCSTLEPRSKIYIRAHVSFVTLAGDNKKSLIIGACPGYP